MRTHTQARKEFIFPKISDEEQKIIDLKDANKSYIYCLGHRDCHIKLHERIIIASKDINIICLFADIVGADVELLQRALARCNILNLFKYQHIQAFFGSVKDSNVNKFQKIIFDSKNEILLRMFIKHVKRMDLYEFFEKEILPTNDIILIDWYISKIGFIRSSHLLHCGRVSVVEEI